jgi:hypothetical protein
MGRYARSCGLLLLPILVWNAVLVRFLPPLIGGPDFWRDIPAPLAAVENTLRLVVSVLPFLMPLELTSGMQRKGLGLYALGVALYFSGWVALMMAPSSQWARSLPGFFALSCTPLIWLVGLALLGQRLYWGRFYRWWMFLIPVAGFITAHVGHTALVYARAH